MPTLYPENVQYGATEVQAPPLGRALSGAASAARKLSTQKRGTQLIDPNQINQLLAAAQQRILNRQQPAGPSIYEIAHGTVPSYPSHEETVTGQTPLGSPYVTPTEKTSPIPGGYKTWGTDVEGRWVAPTGTAKMVAVPEFLGAGQYITDPSQKGKLIKSERDALTDPDLYQALSPEEKMRISRLKSTLTGGLPDIQIDHIIPLWAGGTNTFENLEPLRVDQHALKTKIQSVPLTLMANGKIDKNKALLMAQQWKYIADNFNPDEIPQPYEMTETGKKPGTIDLKRAEELAKEWEKTPPLTWGKFWKEVPLARRAIGESVAGVTDKNLPKFLSGAVKGFTQEATMGIIPTPEAKGTSENIGRIVGSALGFLVPFMGTVGLVKKIGTTLGLKALRIGKEAAAVESAAKPIYGLKSLPYVEGAKIPIEYIDKTKQVLVDNILKNAGTFAAYGQLRTSMPTLFGDPDPGMEQRVKQLVFDSIYGGLTGKLSQNFSSYAKLGGITLGLGLMETGNVNDSFANALTLMAIHKLAPMARGKTNLEAEQKTKEFMDKLTSDMDAMANKTAVDTRSIWLPKEYEQHRKNNTVPKDLTSERINAENDLILDRASTLVKDGRLSPEDYERIKIQAITSGKQLLEGGQSELVRKRNAVREILSTADFLKKREQGQNFSTPDELLKLGEKAPREVLFSGEGISGYEPLLKARLTGLAKGTDPVTAENQRMFLEAKKENRASSQIFLVRRDNMEPLVRKINRGITQEEIDNKIHKPSEKPWNNVEAYGIVVNPQGQIEFLRLGWIPREFRIEGSKDSINESVRRLNEELKSSFETYDPKHNKDLISDFLRKENLKIGTAEITGSGIAKRSGEPWMEVVVTNKSIENARNLKQWYEGIDIAKPKEQQEITTVRSALNDAGNNPSPENSKKAVQAIASERYLDPITEIDLSLKEKGINPPVEWVIIRDISDFFKNIFSGNKNLIKNNINEKFGPIIDDAQAKRLAEESSSIGWRDMGTILYKGLKNKPAGDIGVITYKEIYKFFDSPEYKSSDLSLYLPDVPFVGIGKQAPTQKLETAVLEPVKETVKTKAGQELTKEMLPSGKYWLEQTQQGHKVEHLMKKDGGYARRIRIDGKEYTYEQAQDKVLKPNRIYDSAIVADAPDVIATSKAKSNLIKEIFTPEKIKERRIDELKKSLFLEGEDALGKIRTNDRKKYLKLSRSAIEGIDIKISNKDVPEKMRIEDAEYKKIKNEVVDELKARVNNEVKEMFPVDEEIRFQEGGILPKGKKITLEEFPLEGYEDAEGIFIPGRKELYPEIPLKELKEREFTDLEVARKRIEKSNESLLGIRQPKEYIKEDLPEKIKKAQETFEFLGKSKKEAENLAKSMWTKNIVGFHKLLNENIKLSSKGSATYGANKFINEAITHGWGKNWQNRADLNAYFGLETERGRRFWNDNMYTFLNAQGYPISQPKDIIRKLQEKPYNKMSKEEKDILFQQRRKEVSEYEKESLSKEEKSIIEETFPGAVSESGYIEGVGITSPIQGASENITDMTFFDLISPGRISAEIGMKPDAVAGARDARAFLYQLKKAYNSNVRYDNEHYRIPTGKEPKPLISFNEKILDSIEESIKKEMEAVKSIEKIRDMNLGEMIRNLKANVESLERKKEKEGYLPEDMSKLLEENRALYKKLESQNK